MNFLSRNWINVFYPAWHFFFPGVPRTRTSFGRRASQTSVAVVWNALRDSSEQSDWWLERNLFPLLRRKVVKASEYSRKLIGQLTATAAASVGILIEPILNKVICLFFTIKTQSNCSADEIRDFREVPVLLICLSFYFLNYLIVKNKTTRITPKWYPSYKYWRTKDLSSSSAQQQNMSSNTIIG